MTSPGSPSNLEFLSSDEFAPSDDTSQGVATINIEEIDLDGDDTTTDLLPDDVSDPLEIWTDFRVINYYEIDMHRYMAGITSPDGFQGDTAAFFQLAGPTLLWLSRWTACRIAKMPDIPDPPNLKDKDWVLLDLDYETGNIALMRDSDTPIYRISGMFTFGHKKPLKTGNILDLMAFGKPPWIDDSQIARKVGGIKQVSGVIDDAKSQSSSLSTILNIVGVTGKFPTAPGVP